VRYISMPQLYLTPMGLLAIRFHPRMTLPLGAV
jgi:hypothetical protein